jgi:hypothetical protein
MYTHLKLVLLAILLLSARYASAANPDSLSQLFKHKNNFQLELGGHGGLYSLNYERILVNRQKFKTTAQAGFSCIPLDPRSITLLVPVMVNELISFDRHHVEIGLGYLFMGSTHTENLDYFTGRIGYRYQKPDGRWLVRVGFLGVLNTEERFTQFDFIPWFGLSVGYSFTRIAPGLTSKH